MNKQTPILLVEDDERDALRIRTAFAKARLPNPYQVVNDGDSAISYLKGTGLYSNREQHPLPGLVLLDLRMVGMDGFQVLQWIRSQPELKTLRVVVLTSSTEVWVPAVKSKWIKITSLEVDLLPWRFLRGIR